MIHFTSFAALAALASSVLATPTALATLNTVDGDKVANSYIVQARASFFPEFHLALTLCSWMQLKKGTDKANSIGWLGKQHANASSIKYADWDSDVLHGFAAQLQPEALQALRAFPDIESISEDGYANASAVTQ
jgi:cerevisin